jgi:hypothetical protein
MMAKGGTTNYNLHVGTMSNPADAATFSMAQDLAIASGWNEYVINLTDHTAAGQFIAIKHGLGATSRSLYVDDITFELISPNDLAAIAISGNTTPSVDMATNYSIDVYNNGTATQSVYQVQLVDGSGTVLAQAAGTEIAPGETQSISVAFTPAAVGAMSLQGKVVLASDVNADNDLTSAMQIMVQPEDIIAVTIGAGDEMQGIPWEFFYRNSLFQTILYEDEIGLFGQINSIAFYNNFTTDLSQTPVKLWLGTTELDDLSAGWIDPTTLTLVYDGMMDFPSGQNTIVLPLNAPYNYFSGNLVLYANRPFDTQYYSSSDDFLAQTVGTNRARKLVSDSTTYDPMAPSATGSLSGTFPKTTLFMTVDGMGSLSGVVSASGTPLADVEISINEADMTTVSNANGEYQFPYVLEGTYTVSAHKVGYEDQTLPASIVEDEDTILNITMVESASVNVTGTVTGSDAPTVGLDEVQVTLSGVLEYTATGNAQGEFTVENVLSGNTYNYAISRAGYQTATGSITVGASSYDMGTIILNELTLPPSGIIAEVNDAETQVDIVWRSPGTPGNFHFFDFDSEDGGWQATATWDAVGDWEHSTNYDLSQFTYSYTGTNVTPPPAAHSQTGMWGTVMHSNYTNSAGSNYLSKTIDLSGFTNTQMRFWSWENTFGDWDYCQVLVNGTLVWGPSWEYTGTTWLERVIDLSAYDGMSNVEIQFEMYATSTVNYAGWYIDDVFIGPADAVVRTSAPSVMPREFAGLSEEAAAQLANTSSIGKATRRASNSRQTTQPATRIPVGYQVWRLESGQENSPNLWTSLTPATITDTTFTDPGWPAFENGLYKWAVRTVYTNDVLSNPGFSNTIRKEPNELSALSITGNSTPTVGAPSQYTVVVKNTGTSEQAAGAYTVKIMSDDTELASVSGPAIEVGEELDVVVNFSPTAQGEISIYGKVVLPNDSNPANDETAPINLYVMPSGQFGYTVGDGSELQRVPLDMYYKNSLFQMLIFPAELSNFMGFINGLQFYNNFVTDLPNMPTKIWFETTTLQNLSDAWVPVTANSTLVFDGQVNYPAGENTITIPFAEPFMYLDGQNLLITVQRPMDTAYYSTNDKFEAQTIGSDRARKMQSDSTEYDPAAPSSQGTLSGTFPKTTILGIPGGVGHLSGTVTTNTGSALEGVLVQIEDTGYQATSDEDGNYQIQYILPDTYNVVFSRYGYISQTLVLELEEDEEAVLDAVMQPMPMVPVTGTVLASDTGLGLAGAVIQLEGYANYDASTDSEGEFEVAQVYANQEYEYFISCPGYTPESGTITVGATAYEMDAITLSEIAYAPHSLVAELNDTYTAADLVWEAPDPNAIEITESFEDATFPPENWSQVITNSGDPNTAGVYPTFTRLGTVSGTSTITPTHGSSQTGLWWSYEHQDEWLITPAFNCPPEGYIRFDSFVFLGSTHGDHYYVKVSTDGGNSWTPIWDASSEIGGESNYEAPFVVDLTPYGGQQINLAFNAEDPPSNDGLWYTWFIDNIYIGNAQTMAQFEYPIPVVPASGKAFYAVAGENMRKDGSQDRATTGHYNRSRSTQRNERVLQGYHVFRFISGQENNEAMWEALTDEEISTLSFSDDAWDDLPNGSYRWAVKAVYTAGVISAPAFSNTLVKDIVTGNLVGFVRREHGAGIRGATISVGDQQTQTNTAGAYALTLEVGSYTVTVSAEDYDTQVITDVTISPNQNTTLNVVLSPVANEDDIVPVTATVLKGNSPNPFNPETTIYYDLLDAGKVRLDVYNVKGQKVRTLVNTEKQSGRHSVVFDARDDNGRALSSGVYIYRFNSGKYSSTKKMMLME